MKILKSLFIKIAWLLVIPVFSSLAMATDMNIFGLPLGKKFIVPECKKIKNGQQVVYRISGNEVCFEKLPADALTSDELIKDSVIINFPKSEGTKIISGYRMLALILDGKLEGAGFNTDGAYNSGMVFENLKGKYGAPTGLIEKVVENRQGNTFDTFYAIWNLSDLFVSFQSVRNSLNNGLVSIYTKRGKKWKDERLRKLTKDRFPWLKDKRPF